MFTSWVHSVSDADTKEEILNTNKRVSANILFVSISNTGSEACTVSLYLNVGGTDYLVANIDLEAQGSTSGSSDTRFATKIVVPEESSINIESDKATVDAVLSGEEYPFDEGAEWPGLYYMTANEVSWSGLAPGAEIVDEAANQLYIIFDEEGDYGIIPYTARLAYNVIATPVSIHIDWSKTLASGVNSDGTARCYGDGSIDVSDWEDIADTLALVMDTDSLIIGLKTDGTVIGKGDDIDSCLTEVSNWKDIVALFGDCKDGAGATVFGLKDDGTVVAAGKDDDNVVSGVDSWVDVKTLDFSTASYSHGCHVVGLKNDGTVFTEGADRGGCVSEPLDWEDIVSIAVGSGQYDVGFTAGAKSDGTVVVAGTGEGGVDNDAVSDWTDIVAIAGDCSMEDEGAHLVGLKSDGTVIATGTDTDGCVSGVSDWTDIELIFAARGRNAEGITVGVKSNGDVVAAGSNNATVVDELNSWTGMLMDL